MPIGVYPHKRGAGAANWRGGKATGYDGRVVPEHIAVAERILRKRLPAKAIVHHADGDHFNNAPSNLVVCENQSYHKLLHLRAEAMRAVGDPTARRCWACGRWESDLTTGVGQKPNFSSFVHGICRNMYARLYSRRKKPPTKKEVRQALERLHEEKAA